MINVVARQTAPVSAVGRHLERKGLLERDLESSQLTLDPDEDDGMNALLGYLTTQSFSLRR